MDCFGFLRLGLAICSLGSCATKCCVYSNGVPVPSKSTYNSPLSFYLSEKKLRMPLDMIIQMPLHAGTLIKCHHFLFLFFVETGFFCVALHVLELTP